MNLNLFLLAVRARMGILLLVLGVTVAAATVVSLLLPKSYKATALLLVDANKDEQSLSNVLMPQRERISYMQTQTDIITSPKVARKVVQDLKLAESPASREAFEKEKGNRVSIEDWLVEGLLKRLKVEASQSNVVQLSFSAADPRFAALTTNAFAKSYIDTVLELRVEPTRQAAAWFDEQLKSLRASLEDAQARLTDYHRQKGIISADERLDVENTRLAELSSQLVKVQDQTFELETRERQAREALARGLSPDRLPDVLSNPYIQRLNVELLQGEAKLQELATHYGPNYPQYQRQLSETRDFREKIGVEANKIVGALDISKRQNRQREAELKRALAEQRMRLLELKESRNELTVLTRNVETAQRTYEIALQRSVVNQVESRASQTNVALLSPAVEPHKPSHPRLALNIVLAAIVGTMLGVGAVILMELLDRRVRSAGDLGDGSNVPLLAVLNARLPAGQLLLGRPGGAERVLPKPG